MENAYIAYVVAYVTRLTSAGASPIGHDVYYSREKAEEACAEHRTSGRHPFILVMRLQAFPEGLPTIEQFLNDVDLAIDEYEGTLHGRTPHPPGAPASRKQLADGLRKLKKYKKVWGSLAEELTKAVMKDPII